MGAGAAGWKLTPKAILNANFEYQHKNQRSVCGYQLLGGTTVPDINRIYTSTMLGEQSWEKPNTFDTFNTNARLDYDLPRAWRAFIAGSFSHSLIDDNVVYAYGNSIAAPYYFFAPDGTYDIYDYRNPGELRMNAVAEGIVTGHVTTGAIAHDLSAGGTIFLRSVQQPGFYTVDNPTAPDGTGQDGSVYYYVGAENIYQPIAPVDLDAVEDPHQTAGPRRLWEDNHQAALVMQDRMHLPGRIQLLAAGRYDSLRDHNYSAYASDPTAATTFTDKYIWLPQFAVTYNPVDQLTLYGNYGVLMSLGPQAPWWVDNSNQFLTPFFTRQAEIGAKFEPNQRLLITADVFRMRAPFFYPKLISTPDSVCKDTFNPTSADNLCFESEGHETHNGAELNVGGKVANWLRLSGSLAAIQATSDDTGTPAFDNKQVLNVPRVRTAFFADLAVPHARGLHLLPGWGFTGRKEATRDASVSVSGYNLFNMGARYTPGGESGRMTFRLYADNIANKRYWKDTGASLGDTFIHLGAPTTVRLSAHYTF
jgi:iron complex outermembrane recepter protein